jgi:serine/threonine-protein kinase
MRPKKQCRLRRLRPQSQRQTRHHALRQFDVHLRRHLDHLTCREPCATVNSSTTTLLKRFRDETEILAQLRHPNIVTIYDGSGLHEEPPFFVMQWIDGGSLDSPALHEKFREPLRAAALMLTVAEAVQSAHESLVLHRDLKPANILIDTKDRPHVSDFGVAKLLDGEEPQATATIVGSLGFMPPEQAGAIAQPVTTASDVYGLGATLHFLLTGRAPYEAADLLSLLVCFNAGPPTRPKQLAPGIGDDLQRVCLAALEHDPARRYRTAAAFGEDLRNSSQATNRGSKWPAR